MFRLSFLNDVFLRSFAATYLYVASRNLCYTPACLHNLLFACIIHSRVEREMASGEVLGK
jgi:hypothetical protein